MLMLAAARSASVWLYSLALQHDYQLDLRDYGRVYQPCMLTTMRRADW